MLNRQQHLLLTYLATGGLRNDWGSDSTAPLKGLIDEEWMNEWMIYLMLKTWEVFAQSSEPEAHVKNARQTKKYKTR